ncbi:hypothetical protein [Pseudopelagicola sp. nBUS_19]|uniref:hypothetical protein n=1 Tax=Pseudopelagicola sp. nBUS_19 TaxID=3395316 RepID=UPI003EBE8200
MSDTKTTIQKEGVYEIVLIGIGGENYYLYRGEEYLNKLLLADGDIPLPVRCINFKSIIEAKIELDVVVNVSQFWGIHPDIVARLRDSDSLVETGPRPSNTLR